MKILELRLKNLNALYGEWCIDFSHPEYISNGIFALTGPTGAGKSTILDAICLALYGATPRLGKITQSSNEIMSRQTGECYAEVVFESQAGRFRCHWEQRRARKKADGALQVPEHQIADAVSTKIIETKKSLVLGVIEEKTGMDFDRFTRSILLAQGGFDTFLKASAEDKSKILEQITGTAIYSKISSRVHERLRAEKEQLQSLQAGLADIGLLSSEEVQAIEIDLKRQQDEDANIGAQASETKLAIDWLNHILALQENLNALSETSKALNVELVDFKPQREKLAQAEKAATLAGEYSALQNELRQKQLAETNLQVEQAQLPALTTASVQASEALEKTVEQTLRAKNDLKQAMPIIQKVRALDQSLADQQKLMAVDIQACDEAANKMHGEQNKQQQFEKAREDAIKRMNDATQYLLAHAQDEVLVANLAGLEEQFNQLANIQNEVAQQHKAMSDAKNTLQTAQSVFDHSVVNSKQVKQALDAVIEAQQSNKRALADILAGKLLREYRAEKDSVLRELALINKITALESHRKQLEDGQPCALCGALEHPYAEGNVPEVGEAEAKIAHLDGIIDKAEKQQQHIDQLAQDEANKRQEFVDAEKNELQAASVLQEMRKALVDLKQSQQLAKTDLEQTRNRLLGELKPLGIDLESTTVISDALNTLKTRLQQWQAHTVLKATIENECKQLDSDLMRTKDLLAVYTKAHAQSEAALTDKKQNYQAALESRQALYGDKNANDEEVKLNQALEVAERAEQHARALHDEGLQKLKATEAKIELHAKSLAAAQSTSETLVEEFKQSMLAIGFASQAAFIDARMTAEAHAQLAERAKALDEKQTSLIATRKEREMQLSNEKEKCITSETLETLQSRHMTQESTLKALRDNMARLNQSLHANTVAMARVKDKQAAIELSKQECNRWQKLHDLIGSADGKRYRNFAQGLTFELMVSHANKQLTKMTDRYLLVRDTQTPLTLNVIDNYQAGEVRSTKNLSGGENFIVSLTLALGLSKMASRKVRVDSLFLDEGFGTLDEEALETALDTLSGLQQDGKLIGVISHVPALKERINTQISVNPLSGGQSALLGPGCRQLKLHEAG